MSIFICWILFPLLFCALALGCGLLVRRISGAPLSGVLLLPLGFATIIVASQVTTYWGATTFLATPLVIVLAVAGLALEARDLRPATCDLYAAAAGAGTFAVFAAPVVLSGSATFLGYTLLGDTSIHFILIDWVMKHGSAASPHLPPSSYHAALSSYLTGAYPLGAHTALGAVRPLVGQDVAWVFQPYLALISVFTALSIYAVLSTAIAQRWLLAVAAFLAAQPALVYAYALEGSLKELATACLIATLVAAGAEYVRNRGGTRRLVPLAVTTAAGIGVLNASILAWLGPALVAVVAALLVGRGLRGRWAPNLTEAGAFLGLTALLCFPSLAVINTFLHDTTATLTAGSEFGNLLGPLRTIQAFGIWPTGDFRLPLTNHSTAGHILIWVEIAALAIGLVWAIRRRHGWPLVLVTASLIGSAYVASRSNAWGDAKALVIVSPAIVAAAMLGPAALWSGAWRPAALALAGAIAFGVLWTNALAYHYAEVAPRGRLAELAGIGSKLDGQGPTLYTEFEEFGKHFLRQGNPTGSNEGWQDPPRATLASGGPTRFGFSSDIDELAPGYVQRFRTLVLRRSASFSLPPSNYRLVSSGRFYDVWRKTTAPVPRHLPLGTPPQPAAVPPCRAVRALAGSGGARLAYVERPRLPVLFPAQAQHPRFWAPDGTDPTNLRPYGAGTLTGSVRVARPGRYTVWVQGSFNRRLTLSADGQRLGEVHANLDGRGQSTAVGTVTLQAGRHTIQLVRPGGSLRPGDGGTIGLLGPIVLDPSTDAPVVRTLAAARWRQLCGRNLDWVEALP